MRTGLQIYDTNTKTWELGPVMPKYLHRLSGAVVGDKLYVAGYSRANKNCVCAYFIPESTEWKYTAPIGPVHTVDSLQCCHAVNHSGSLWVLYRGAENYWLELEDDGEWSRVSPAIAPVIPDGIGIITAVASAVFEV